MAFPFRTVRLTALRRRDVLGAALLLAAGSAAAASRIDSPPASEAWQKLRADLFGSRPIASASVDELSLEAPFRAEDASTVPIRVHAGLPQTPQHYVAKLYLVIDRNPSPVAGVFQFTPSSGRADIETRVRIAEYSHVRAIAETSDGRLLMASRYVRAAGGCSVPPAPEATTALSSLGRLRLRVQGDMAGSQPVLAQLAISHPNHCGLAMDPVSRLFTPAHFVRKVNVSYAGDAVLSADVDFSISENPNFRFYFIPRGLAGGELKADVVDSRDLRFEGLLSYRPHP